jgi:hypothetical protein
MPHRILAALILLMLVHVVAACDRTNTPPLGPSRPPADNPPPPVAAGPGIRGTVHDTAFRRLADATVEIVNGPHAGTSVRTSASGEFTLPGSFEPSTLFRASAEGYLPATMQHPHGYIDYYLERSMAPVQIRGDYNMTFLSDPACADMPDYLRERTYRASVTPGSLDRIPPGLIFDLKLEGVEPLDNPSIGVAGNAVGFRLFNDGYPFIVERVSPSLYVTITGWAEVEPWPVDSRGFSVAFDGWIEAHAGPPSSPGRTYGRCKSISHRLEMRPR